MVNTTNILTADQAHLLDALSSVGSMTLKELQALSGMHQKRFFAAQLDLRERQMIETDGPIKNHQPMQMWVSMTGQRALADHKLRVAAAKAKADQVPPPTFTTQGTYEPPKRVYYRNNGNCHIASYGVRC